MRLREVGLQLGFRTDPNSGAQQIYISAWASALLVRQRWATRRPQAVGRVTGTDSHAFFVYVL